jgi:tetratricopeptide (TPR) repeat protein
MSEWSGALKKSKKKACQYAIALFFSIMPMNAFGETKFFETTVTATYLQFTNREDVQTAILARTENNLFKIAGNYIVDAGFTPQIFPDSTTYIGVAAGILEPEIALLNIEASDVGFLAEASVQASVPLAKLKNGVEQLTIDPVYFPNAVAGRVQVQEILKREKLLEQELTRILTEKGVAGFKAFRNKHMHDSRANQMRLRAVTLNDRIIRHGESGLQEKPGDILSLANDALEQDASNAWLFFHKGRALSLLDQAAQAEAAFTRAIEIDPYFFQAFFYRGMLYNGLAAYEQAILDFDMSINQNTQFYRAYVQRGIAKRENGRPALAILDFRRALQIKPDDVSALNESGITYQRMHRYQEALDAFDRALALDPEYATTYVNRGDTLLGMGREAEGCRELRKACELNRCSDLNRRFESGMCTSQDASAAAYWSRKSFTYVSSEQWVMAFSAASIAISHDPGQIVSYINRCWALAEMGQFDKALDDCHTAVHIDPQAAEAYNNRGLVYQKMKAMEKAGEDYLKACSLGLKTGCTNYLEINQQ